MNTYIEKITPTKAEAYLLKIAPHQRPLRNSWVNNLAAIMQSGNFHLTHQGIAFDCNGYLFDGQHRLRAIVQSGTTVEMQVARGVSIDAWHATDIGRKRTYSDITAIPKVITEPIRYAIQITRGLNCISAEEIIRINGIPLGENLKTLKEFCPTCVKYFSSAPLALMAAAWMTKTNSLYPMEQYRALVHQDYDKMSGASKAISRSANTGCLKATNPLELVVKAFVVFDPKNENLLKIMIKDQDSKVGTIRKFLISMGV